MRTNDDKDSWWVSTLQEQRIKHVIPVLYCDDLSFYSRIIQYNQGCDLTIGHLKQALFPVKQSQRILANWPCDIIQPKWGSSLHVLISIYISTSSIGRLNTCLRFRLGSPSQWYYGSRFSALIKHDLQWKADDIDFSRELNRVILDIEFIVL